MQHYIITLLHRRWNEIVELIRYTVLKKAGQVCVDAEGTNVFSETPVRTDWLGIIRELAWDLKIELGPLYTSIANKPEATTFETATLVK